MHTNYQQTNTTKEYKKSSPKYIAQLACARTRTRAKQRHSWEFILCFCVFCFHFFSYNNFVQSTQEIQDTFSYLSTSHWTFSELKNGKCCSTMLAYQNHNKNNKLVNGILRLATLSTLWPNAASLGAGAT